MRAISSFSFEEGSSTRSCSALLALRMRVSMSATGSVIIGGRLLPRALRHAGDDALVGELPQADAAKAELLVHGARPPALVAARVVAHLVLRGTRGLRDQRLLGHLAPLLFRGERHAQAAQQRLSLFIRLRTGRDRDVEAADLLDAVVVDLGENDLLADAQRVVAAPVERVRVEAAEVADAREGDRD